MQRTTDDVPATEPDSAPDDAPSGPPSRSNRLTTWLRSIGIVRGDGWLGGVCAGVADALGVDAVIVRGAVVVVAVLGGPVVLLYAAAWFFLPHRTGGILAEQLVQGRLEKGMFGVACLVLLSFLPLTQGFWYAGATYWGEPDLAGSLGRILWTAVLIAGALVFLLWFARRAVDGGRAEGPAEQGSACTEPEPEPETAVAREDVAGTSVAVPQPPAPPADASTDDLRAWREQQALWRRQRAAWVADQRRGERERSIALSRARAVEVAAASAERRRIDRLTRPRLGGGFVAIAVGLATVSGSMAALLSLDTGHPAVVGFGVGTLVLGLSIAGAGAARRRSGFLSLLGGAALLGLLVVALLPSDRVPLLFVSSYGLPTVESGRYATLSGNLSLYVGEDHPETEVVDIWQGAGGISIDVEPGRTVRVEANTSEQNISVGRYTADGDFEQVDDPARYSADGDRVASTTVIGQAAVPDLVVRVWQGSGWIDIRQYEEADTSPSDNGTEQQP